MNVFESFRDRDLATGTAEDEYLDAVFDTAALEREVSELTGFDEWHGNSAGGGSGAGSSSGSGVGAGGRASGDRQPSFAGFTASREVLDRIEEVRELQQRVFHSHLKVEVNLNNFVQAQSADVSKAEASAKVCRNFRNEFDAKKNIIEDVSELLSELAEKVDGVNKLVVGDVGGGAGGSAGGGTETRSQRRRRSGTDANNSTSNNNEGPGGGGGGGGSGSNSSARGGTGGKSRRRRSGQSRR
jgi:hypothetical protein